MPGHRMARGRCALRTTMMWPPESGAAELAPHPGYSWSPTDTARRRVLVTR
jgi:hypothetical protein